MKKLLIILSLILLSSPAFAQSFNNAPAGAAGGKAAGGATTGTPAQAPANSATMGQPDTIRINEERRDRNKDAVESRKDRRQNR